MKLELVREMTEDYEGIIKGTCREYRIGAYEVEVTTSEFASGRTSKRISVRKDFEAEFLPDIYFESSRCGEDVNEFKIQTTSYGYMNPEGIKKVIEGYNVAMEVVAVLTAEFIK